MTLKETKAQNNIKQNSGFDLSFWSAAMEIYPLKT